MELQKEFKSYHRIDKHLKDRKTFQYFEPEAIEIYGVDGPVTFMYVSVKETMKRIVSDPTFIPAEHVNDGYFLRDLKDGTAYKSNEYFKQNPEAHTLMLYSDGFELCNPLGAKRGFNKLVNIYMSVVEIEKHNRSKTENLFLVMSVRESDLKKNRNTIYRVLVEDLKELENGIVHDGKLLKAGLLCQIGDNLEQHLVGGFKQSFAQNEICRYCYQEYDKLPDIDGIPKAAKRTKEEYDSICSRLESWEKGQPKVADTRGIKYRCIFNELKAFHCIGQLPFDVMHDFHELVACDDAQSIIMALVNSGYFTLDAYNQRLDDIHFADYECGDKPLDVKARDEKLRGKAMSIALHVRVMPLVISDILKDNHEQSPALDLLVLLHRLNEFMLADSLSVGDVITLQDLIIDYYSTRKICCEIYTTFSHLKPKNHYLEHLPSQLLHFGPFTTVWTARFESHHRDFVNFMESSKNWINVLKTLCEKNQKRFACRLYTGLFATPQIQFPSKKCTLVETDGSLPKHLFGACDIFTNRVIVKNTLYRVGHLIVTKVISDNMVNVGLIKKIVVKANKLYFLVDLHECARRPLGYFDAKPLKIQTLIIYSSLQSYKPLIRRTEEQCFSFLLHHHLPSPL